MHEVVSLESQTPAVASVKSNIATEQAHWWRIADAAVLLLYSSVVLFTVRYHEKWADEAQAWLIARDLDLKTIWFHELRYEGSPGLWHTILWIAQHVFHASYNSLGYIGATFAIAGAALLIFKAPFPRYVRWPLAFTYVMVYQYAVIARPYTLLPLLCFAAAIYFNDLEHPQRITIVLVLLSLLTLHGTLVAGCIALAYLIEVIREWDSLSASTRNNFIICVVVMTFIFAFVVLILKPTSDVAEFAPKDAFAQMGEQVTAAQKIDAAVCGAFFDYTLPSFAFVFLAGIWCFSRKRLLTFALPVGLLTALYAVIHGYAHHHGAMFVAAITGLWIAWPDEKRRSSFSVTHIHAIRGMLALMLALCAVNIWDAVVSVTRDYRYPYSGAEDAANYLKSVGADRVPVFGYLFGTVAVQAYFDHNILTNMPSAYFHQGTPLKGITLDADEVMKVGPEYILAYSNAPDLLVKMNGPTFTSLGYELVHFSDGYYMYKRGVYQRETYFIFRRVRPGALRTP